MDLRTIVEDIDLYLKNNVDGLEGQEKLIVQDLQKAVDEIKVYLNPPPPPVDSEVV